MKQRAILMSFLLLEPLASGRAQEVAAIDSDRGRHMASEAKGNFDIQIKPDATSADGIGRFTIDKTFHGGIEGASTGSMVAVRTSTAGSAGYVLIEHVSGVVNGKSGGFMLQHSGIMERGKPALTITVIPDSGTGDLTGIAGEMTIDAAANHAYVLTYSLPAE